MDANNVRPIEILLVEDNPADVRMVIEAMKEGRIANRMSVVWDGAEAIDFLLKKGKYGGTLRPDIILLDLKLPKVDGHEVLEFIRSEAELRDIPVMVLTTSEAEADLARSYENSVNYYATKPLDAEKLLNAIRSVDGLWLTVVRIPPQRGAGSAEAN